MSMVPESLSKHVYMYIVCTCVTKKAGTIKYELGSRNFKQADIFTHICTYMSKKIGTMKFEQVTRQFKQARAR